MPKELATPPYFQIPKILLEQPKITGDHIFIFMILYEQLRQPPCDKKGYNKTNEELSGIINVSMSVIKRRLNDIEKWGFLSRRGLGSKRMFMLGEKFNNRVISDPVLKTNRVESIPILGQKRPYTGSNRNYIANNSSKNNTNKEIYSFEQKQKYQEYAGRFKSDQNLGLKEKDASPLAIEDWANIAQNT